jgi:hypothetical protein
MRTGVLTDHRLDANGMGNKTAELLDDPNFARFSQEKVLEGLNDAIAEFCVRTQCKFDGVDIEFVDGTRDYNIKTAIDAGGTSELGYIARVGIYDGTSQDFPYELLKGVPLLKQDRFGLSTIGDGMPVAWFSDMVDFHQISFTPVPNDDYDAGPPKDNGAYILYIAVGDLMTYTAGNFGNLDDDIPTLAQLPICHGAAGFVLEYGGMAEVEKALKHFAKFEKGISDFTKGFRLAQAQKGMVPL